MSEKLEVKNGSVVFAVVNKCSAVMRPFYPHTHTHTHTHLYDEDRHVLSVCACYSILILLHTCIF